jgi:hypothetical protein
MDEGEGNGLMFIDIKSEKVHKNYKCQNGASPLLLDSITKAD